MPTNEEIKTILDELEKEPFPVQPFREKYKTLLYAVFPYLLEMVPIPAGHFQRVSYRRKADNKLINNVTLSTFQMAKYPVTFKQWSEVKEWAEKNGYSFLNQGKMGAGNKANENHPITRISWYDAVLWCNALSEKEERTPCYYTNLSQMEIYRNGKYDLDNEMVYWKGDGYRLPTEAEWDYACRAGTTTVYSYGDSIDQSQANFNVNENGTTPVGKYGANAWGLYDMHGNVWEWCWDWHDSHYYKSSPTKNPLGPSDGSSRVMRGGDWTCEALFVRSASRDYDQPHSTDKGYGFRPVCKAE